MMTRRWPILLCLLAAVLLLICATVTTAAPAAPVQVAFINVGQGDSTLIQSGDFAVLIDGGQPWAGPTVVAYLRQQALPDVDVMLATHADSDHIGGLADVLASGIPVRQVLYNGYAGNTATWASFATAVANAGLTLTATQYGQVLTWGETTAYVLNPLPGLTNPEQNDAAVVVRVDHAAVHYMLPSDADSTVEAAIRARGTPVAAQILKVAHHGSQYSSSAAFLADVQPQQAVISVGPNSYGHPAAETLARLQATGALIWRTDQDGTVAVTDDGGTYQVRREQETHLLFLPLVARQEPPTPTATLPPTPSSTPTPTTPPISGANVVCQWSGAAEICAWVAQADPAQNSTETVSGRLLINGEGQANQTMNTSWHYKTTTSSCSGTTGADGVAACSRSIGQATKGYRVHVDVAISGYQATTWFTPQ